MCKRLYRYMTMNPNSGSLDVQKQEGGRRRKNELVGIMGLFSSF